MDREKELTKNTLIITIGKVCTQFVSFFLLPIYTSALTKAEYGIVDVVNSYVQLVVSIIYFQMDQALFRYMIIGRGKKEEQEKCISTISIFFIVQTFILIVLVFSLNYFKKIDFSIYLCFNAIAIGLSSFALNTARGLGDNTVYSIASFICGAVTIGLNVLFIIGFRMKVEGMLLATIIGNIMAFLFVIYKNNVLRYIKKTRVDYGLLKRLLSYSIPLIPNAVLWWVINASDKSIVLAYIGTSENGILAVAHKFSSVIITLYNIFHLSWTESASLHLREDDGEQFFSSVFDTVFRAFSALCILIIGFMPFAFDALVDESFNAAFYLIPIYAVSSLFNVIAGTYSVIYVSEMRTKEITKTSVVAGIVNIVISILMINFYGLYAVAIGTLVSFGVMALYRAIDTKKYLQRTGNHLWEAITWLVLLLGIIVYYFESHMIKVMFLCFAIVYTYLLNKKSIINIINYISAKIKGYGQ